MRVFFGQIYIEPGIKFPFSHELQKYLGTTATAMILSSSAFATRFGEDWDLIIRISAKTGLCETKIKGPSVFKKSKDVEFSIFLPFDVITKNLDPLLSALESLFVGIDIVLDSLEIKTINPLSQSREQIEKIRNDSSMFST